MSAVNTTLSAAEAAARLIEGNLHFRQAEASLPASAEHIHHLYQFGQHPWAVVLTCSDSRVPPELLFHCSLGDLFVIRSAGHTINAIGIGSIEYAVLHLGVRLVLVLGHTSCGAVAAALEESPAAQPGNLSDLIASFEPAISQVQSCADCSHDNINSRVENAHTLHTVYQLRQDSTLSKVDGLAIIGGKYNTDTGEVAFLDLDYLFQPSSMS